MGLSLFAAAGCEVVKPENPLAPTVAGPIPGVAITAPGVGLPTDGTRIPVAEQPIALVVNNSSTTGVRPLSYRFQVAVDKNFANVVFEQNGVEPDASGKTTARLPSALAPERGYYWRAKAYDGANDGDFSATVFFEVFTPVVLGTPQALEPSGSASSTQPTFRIGNASRTGPAGAILYNIQLSSSIGFTSIMGNWFTSETPSTSSLASPIGLPNSATFYWRVRAREATAGDGPWSSVKSFTTPAPAPVSPPPGGGASCNPASTSIGIVECRRNQYPTPMSPSQVNAMLRGIAHDLNASSIPNPGSGPFGVFPKTTGNNCGGISCDIICRTSGHWWDVLTDSEGAAIPGWGGPHTGLPACEVVP